MKTEIKIYLSILLIMTPGFILAQDRTTNLWAGLGVTKSLGAGFSANVNAQWRFTEDFTTLGSYIGEAGVGYKINKHWKAELNYRYIGRRKYDKSEASYYYRPYHRFYGDISYDRKIFSLLKLDYRIRYQNQFKDDEGSIENDKSYIRNKLELAYPNKSRFTPFVSADLFYQLKGEFDEIRYKGGVDVKLSKKHSLNAGVFTSQELGAATVVKDLTIVVGYKFKF